VLWRLPCSTLLSSSSIFTLSPLCWRVCWHWWLCAAVRFAGRSGWQKPLESVMGGLEVEAGRPTRHCSGLPSAAAELPRSPHRSSDSTFRAHTLIVILTLLPALLAAPLAADAQQAGTVPRIGFLRVTSPSDRPPLLDAFRQRLRELGWVEGQNIVIDYRYAEGRVDRLPDLAADLVRFKVDLIVSEGTQGATAAKNATETIPIVMIAVRDPVGTELIASLARPGGNVTGVSGYAGLKIVAKQLELLKETVPKVRRVAILSNPDNAYHQLAIR